jgi:hypothetical protein
VAEEAGPGDCPALLEMEFRDESISGVGLWSPLPLARGMMLCLLAAGTPAGSTGILVSVRQCRATAGGWVVRRPEE